MYYSHFLALSCAIRLLANPILVLSESEEAEHLLKYFFKHYKSLYGQEQLSYNVNSLLHLVQDANHFESLDAFSAFRFENKLFTRFKK